MAVTKFDPLASRIETGPIQFGDDWPGIFIRGDNALVFALMVRRVIGRLNTLHSSDGDWIDKAMLKGLAETLESCSVGNTGWPPGSVIDDEKQGD